MDLNDYLQTIFDKLETFFRTETVVGEPLVVGSVTLIPLIEISFGLGSGGEGSKAKDKEGASGAGAGAKIIPTAVMVVKGEDVSLIPLKERDSWQRLFDLAPELIKKIKPQKKERNMGQSREE